MRPPPDPSPPSKPPTAALVRQALLKLATPARAAGVARFFKTGKGEYGEGEIVTT